MKFFFVIISFVFFIAVAQANPYKVSVIIFKQMAGQNQQSEQLANELKIPQLKNSINLQKSIQPIDFSNLIQPILLPYNQFGLKRELKKLQLSRDYQVLTYFSWAQDLDQPPEWIHVIGGRIFDNHGNLIADGSQEKDNYYELNGKIKLTLNYYLNFFTDLYLTEPTSGQPIPLQSFIMKQERHLKLEEVNYLDHPVMGVIVYIERI